MSRSRADLLLLVGGLLVVAGSVVNLLEWARGTLALLEAAIISAPALALLAHALLLKLRAGSTPEASRFGPVEARHASFLPAQDPHASPY